MLDLGRTLLQAVERSPRALALVDGDLRLDYGQWLDQIARLAAGLSRLGLARGDRLLVLLQNRWEMATLHWACQFLGVVITPLNWRATAEDIDFCAADAGVAALVFEAASAGALAATVGCRALPRIAVGAAVGGPPGAAIHSTSATPGVTAYGGTLRFEDLIADGDAARGENLQAVASAEDLSVLLYTSGTTGRPKGVPRRHRAERAAAVAHVAQNLYRPGEVALGVMPLYHTMGVRSLLAMSLIDGAFICVPRFDAGRCLGLIEAERVSHLYLVPTLYHDLLNHPAFAASRMESVTRIGFAGAPMSDALLRRLADTCAPELLVNHYGSSEIYTFTIAQQATVKPGSAGRAGLNARVRVVKLDSEQRRSSPQDLAAVREEGQIIADLASDEAFDGYWQRPDADARALREGWYFTGDTGYHDADGDLFVTGRVDDMVISGGENISPVEIESILSLHPGVDEVAVAGLPDERWGQRVVAFIKPAARAEVRADAQALDEHARRSGLMSFKRPREYVFVREIPKSPVGKILRRKLIAGEFDRCESSERT